MRDSSRYYLAWYVSFVAAFAVLVPMMLVYVIDPMQFFRRAAYTPVFSTNERYQIPGLAKNYDYDTVIAGTSMAQNFYPSQADKTLGARTLKLAISGSSAHEQFLVLSVAIRTGKVKRVIWGLDQWAFRGRPQRVRDDLGRFPYYLYGSNPFGYFWYLFNETNFSESLQILRDRSRLFGPPARIVPDEWNTFDRFYRFERSLPLKDYFNPENMRGLDSEEVAERDIDVMDRSLEANTISLIRDNPLVEFDIYFPPYSILNAKFYQVNFPVLYERLLAFQALTIRKLISFKNVRVFDFSDVAEVTHNLDLYKDMGHYNASINAWMIRSIASNDHIVDPSDPEASVRRIRAQVATYPTPVGQADALQKAAN